MTPDEARSYLSSISDHPGRQGDTAYIHPDFAVRLATALQQANSQGLHLGVMSGFRTPGQTGSAYDAGGNSSHTYGLASDIRGLDGPNGQITTKWAQIAAQNGLSNPYGIGNKAEFNHWQFPPQPLEKNPALLNKLKTAYATGDWNKIWNTYSAGTAGTGGATLASVQPSANMPATLTDLIAQTANKAGRPDLIPILNGIRAGESLHGSAYDKKDDALESSWGPFQLNRRAGLGVQFEKENPGYDLRDPATIPKQVEWVTNYLKNGGSLSPWAGYKGPMPADPKWGNSGYDPKGVVTAGTTAPGAPGAPAGGQQQPVPYPVVMPQQSVGQALASLASAPGIGGGSGGVGGYMDTSADQPAIRMPALATETPGPSPIPQQFQGGVSPLASQLGALASMPSPATNELTGDPGSITAGAPSMTAMVGQLGTPAEFNYLDPRRTVAPSLSMHSPRLA